MSERCFWWNSLRPFETIHGRSWGTQETELRTTSMPEAGLSSHLFDSKKSVHAGHLPILTPRAKFERLVNRPRHPEDSWSIQGMSCVNWVCRWGLPSRPSRQLRSMKRNFGCMEWHAAQIWRCTPAVLPFCLWVGGREAVVGLLVAYPSSRGMLLLQGLAEWIFKIGPLIKWWSGPKYDWYAYTVYILMYHNDPWRTKTSQLWVRQRAPFPFPQAIQHNPGYASRWGCSLAAPWFCRHRFRPCDVGSACCSVWLLDQKISVMIYCMTIWPYVTYITTIERYKKVCWNSHDLTCRAKAFGTRPPAGCKKDQKGLQAGRNIVKQRDWGPSKLSELVYSGNTRLPRQLILAGICKNWREGGGLYVVLHEQACILWCFSDE